MMDNNSPLAGRREQPRVTGWRQCLILFFTGLLVNYSVIGKCAAVTFEHGSARVRPLTTRKPRPQRNFVSGVCHAGQASVSTAFASLGHIVPFLTRLLPLYHIAAHFPTNKRRQSSVEMYLSSA